MSAEPWRRGGRSVSGRARLRLPTAEGRKKSVAGPGELQRGLALPRPQRAQPAPMSSDSTLDARSSSAPVPGMMEPNTKPIIDELARCFTEHDAKWERCLADLERSRDDCDAAIELQENNRSEHVNAERDRIAALEAAATDLGTWCLEVEVVVDDLNLKVDKLTKHWGPHGV